MPSEAQHLVKALHNERFCLAVTEGLDSPYGQFHDWVVTGMFYSALHYVDAYMARIRQIHPETHNSRIRSVQRIHRLRPMLNQYPALFYKSLEARYDPRMFTESSVQDLRENNFIPLRDHIRALLSI